MIESKAWNWNEDIYKYWNVADEFLPVALKWKSKNFSSVLDLGCGIGRNALFLAKMNFDVDAFDLSLNGLAQLIKSAKEENLNIKIKNGDMLQLPYKDNYFDCLLAFHSIYHTDLEGLKKVISEINRVLKNGGEIFITLNSKNSEAWDLYSERRIDNYTLIKTEGLEIDVPHTYLNYDDVLLLLKDFNLIKIQQIFDYWENRKYAHYFVTCKKGF